MTSVIRCTCNRPSRRSAVSVPIAGYLVRLDASVALGPVWFGLMLDHGQGREMFYVVAVLLALAVGTVVRVRRAIPA